MTGYPVILGGDHAAFEAEWAASGRPDSERPDWPLPSFDAQEWAKAFCKVFPGCDEETVVGWFANALMRGYDQRTSEPQFKCPVNRTADPPQDCNWPMRGCDERATEVIVALQECDMLKEAGR